MPGWLRRRQPYFSEVLAVLNRHDPEGLLGLPDMPQDEYAPEAEDFARRLRAGDEVTAAVVHEVWERWFGPGSGFVTHAGPGAVTALADDLAALRSPER